MKIFLLLSNKTRRSGKLPYEDADHTIIDGVCPNDDCNADPFKVQGTGKYPSSDDRAWEAEGICMKCHRFVGVIRVETNTLFGVREDQELSRYTTIRGIKVY